MSGQVVLLFLLLCHVNCKLLNVAFNKNASTTSGMLPNWFPSQAVDGDSKTSASTCFHAARSPSDWTVDLGREYQLYNITIYLRERFELRSANSNIYLDNNPSRVCFTFPSTISDNPTLLTCNETARFVTIKNPGSGPRYKDALNICEVKIYSCNNDSYGKSCDQPCHCSRCSRWTGICAGDCDIGWQGQRCDKECNGTYGINCRKSCVERKCATDSTQAVNCNVLNGSCHSGCQLGWKGIDCTEECNGLTYGENCAKICSERHCARESTCRYESGECDTGCQAGWTGIDCLDVCDDDHYGPNCADECSARRCEGNTSCNSTTGRCDRGCLTGWTGVDCSECSGSTYGPKCSQSCLDRHCSGNSSCHNLRGFCDFGCAKNWMGEDCTIGTKGQTGIKQTKLVIIGACTATSLAIIVLLIIFFIIFRRKRRHGQKDSSKSRVLNNQKGYSDDTNVYVNVGGEEDKEEEKPKKSPAFSVDAIVLQLDNTSEEEIEEKEDKPENDDSSYYNLNTVHPNSAIPVCELKKKVEEMKENTEMVEQEFNNQPTDFLHPYDESQKPEHKGKNRFKGYYPYNHNRVVLREVSDSSRGDYINASYMAGYLCERQFIAAQGPYRTELLEDFWRMIWQEGTKIIVMVTGLIEEGKVKCIRYWPENGTESYGDITVTTEAKTTLADFTVTTLLVHHGKKSMERHVKHFHFTSWSDHDVPGTFALLAFMRRVNVAYRQQTYPIIVHCSAGIGRTGTYIAVDSLVKQATTEGVADVVNFVTKMRGQRRNMVQTKEQYFFIYEAVTAAVSDGDTSLDTDAIRKIDVAQVGSVTMGNKTAAQHIEVFQSIDGGEQNSEDASYLASYRNRSDFIVMTSHPDEEELWNRVYNTGAHTLILLTDEVEGYLPSSETALTTETLTVTRETVTLLSDDVMLYTVKLRREDDAEMIRVHCYQVTGDINQSKGLVLVDSLLRWTAQTSCEKSLIVSNSVVEPRILVLLVNIASRLKDDGRVDVINDMRRVQNHLGGPPFSLNDVERCLNFAKGCLESVETYANV